MAVATAHVGWEGPASIVGTTPTVVQVFSGGGGAAADLPWVEATGLVEGDSDGTTNRTAINAQIVTAAAAGKRLRLPTPGRYQVAVSDIGGGNYTGILIADDPDTPTGLIVPTGCTLELADGQATNARTALRLVYLQQPSQRVHLTIDGVVSGNSAGQTGLTSPQGDIAQGNWHDAIYSDVSSGSVADVLIDGTGTIDDWKCHPVYLKGTGDPVYDTNGVCTTRGVTMERYGEGPIVAEFRECHFDHVTLRFLPSRVRGDHFEPSYGSLVTVTGCAVVPYPGEAATENGGSGIDAFGCKNVTIANCVIVGTNNGIDTSASPGGTFADRIAVTNCVIRNVASTFFSLTAYGGRTRVSNCHLVGGSTQTGYSFIANSGTTGTLTVEGCNIVDPNGIQVAAGGAGTFEFINNTFFGAAPLNTRVFEANVSGGTTTKLVLKGNRWAANGATDPPTYLFQFPASGTVPAGWVLENNRLAATMLAVQEQAGSVDTSAVEVVGGLYGDAEPTRFIDDTTDTPAPAFGTQRGKVATGSYLTSLGGGSSTQQLELRFAGPGTLVHGTGDIRLSGAANVTGNPGEIITFRRVSGVWWERSRSGAGVAEAYPASPVGWYTPGPLWCYTDAGMTTRCGDGDLIYTQVDRSGNARHRVQSTSAVRPVLRRDSAGRWYIDFGTGANRYFTCAVSPVYVAEMGWAGRSTNSTWNYGGFINPTGARWQLTDSGFTRWLPDPQLTTVIKNGVALSDPFDCGPITSNMVLQVVSANQVLSPTGWQFNTADSNQYAWEKVEYEHVLWGSTLSAGNRATALALLQARYA